MLVLQDIQVRNILTNLNLQISKGEFVVVTGENGAGKTTLFNTISGQVAPNRGRIWIDGQDVTKESQAARSRWVASVAQDPRVGTLAGMTLRDNMSVALRRGKSRGGQACASKERDDLFREHLQELDMGLEERLDSLVGELSGGQRQALSVMLAFLSDFKILLLDEITAALNVTNARKILDLVTKKCRKAQKTCLMITHNPEQIRQFGDWVVELKTRERSL